MDRRTLLAVVLIAAVVILWPLLLHLTGADRYLNPPRPSAPVSDTTRAVAGDTAAPGVTAPASTLATPAAAGAAAPSVLSAGFLVPDTTVLKRSYVVETDLYRAEFDPRGAKLQRVELKRFRAAHGGATPAASRRRAAEVPPAERVVLAGGPTLALELGSDPAGRMLADVLYAVEERTDAAGRPRALVFTAQDTAGTRVRQTYSVRPGTYALDLEVAIENVPLAWRLSDYSLRLRSWPLLTEHNQVDDERALQAAALLGRDIHRDAASGMRGRTKAHAGNVVWASVQSRYFTAALAIVEGVGKEVVGAGSARTLSAAERARLGPQSPPEQLVAENRLVVGLPPADQPVNRFVVYVGPKDYFLLHKLGSQLERGVDLGWSWVVPFSKMLLQLLIWLHGLAPNYGVAILLLATLVRVLLHPLNMASMKSMRAMQRLQPEVGRLRAKYKDNPQAMNKALMALYKENKVNPAGGCLPLVLQMPIFFALYSVLFHAIELRQAPFVSWMKDLSAPDLLFMAGPFPVRLLPLLMLGSGFLQQKMTPTDPRQLKTMYLTNVFMLVFFYNLPSGLVLYWTVMNLLTALQQWLVLREDGGAAPAPAAVEEETAAVAKKRRGK